MSGFWIVIAFIAYLKLSKPLIKLLNFKSSYQNDIIYTLSGFLAAGILLFIDYTNTSKSSLVVFVFYFFVLFSQIIYWYFKKPLDTKVQK